MMMTPLPIIVLVLPMRLGEIAIIAATLLQVAPISPVFALVPLMIVSLGAIVEAVVALPIPMLIICGPDRHRSKQRSAKQKCAEVATHIFPPIVKKAG